MGHITVRAKAIRDLCNKIFFSKSYKELQRREGYTVCNFDGLDKFSNPLPLISSIMKIPFKNSFTSTKCSRKITEITTWNTDYYQNTEIPRKNIWPYKEIIFIF